MQVVLAIVSNYSDHICQYNNNLFENWWNDQSESALFRLCLLISVSLKVKNIS